MKQSTKSIFTVHNLIIFSIFVCQWKIIKGVRKDIISKGDGKVTLINYIYILYCFIDGRKVIYDWKYGTNLI